MLTPVILATFISVCLPMADPVVAHALVAAGSSGEPLTVMDAAGQKLAGGTERELAAALKAAPADQELYVGLTQIPRSALIKLGIPPESTLAPCTNLRIGYQLYSEAREVVAASQKNPKKLMAVSINYYRNRQKTAEGAYAQKAADAFTKPAFSPPASFGSRLHMAIAAQAMRSDASTLHQTGGQIARLTVARLNNPQ
jgi:hypothetical protein